MSDGFEPKRARGLDGLAMHGEVHSTTYYTHIPSYLCSVDEDIIYFDSADSKIYIGKPNDHGTLPGIEDYDAKDNWRCQYCGNLNKSDAVFCWDTEHVRGCQASR